MRNQSVSLRIGLIGAVISGLLIAAGTAGAAPHTKPAHHLIVRGSAAQVDVTGVAASAKLALTRAGKTVATKLADSRGGAIFYKVKPGKGYRVHVLPHGATSHPITVHTTRAKPWDPKTYDQTIPDSGYGYMTMRDGIKLAYDVRPPPAPAGVVPPITLPGGLPDYAPPYPTLIEYGGYGYANPAGPESGIAALANLMGFAVVDVNMRGTGCSGGAYNFFERLQDLDGYDIIQTVAHQPWVKDHKVGMLGISFGAISQLFTAQTHPPALEAIAPLSTIDSTATTLYPGGILNTGFAMAWAEQRQQNAEPAGPGAGQAWAYQRVQQGDQTCKANQALHGEAENLLSLIRRNTHYRPGFVDTIDPVTFVHKIHVPTFMACQWEDEQTGGHCADLVQHFTGTKHKWFTFTNGVHGDSLDPATFNRWYDFLSLYVAHQAPAVNSVVVRAAAPLIFQAIFGVKTDDFLPPDPIQTQLSYSAAKAAFDKQPSIRVLFDNGAGKPPLGKFNPGNPYPGFEHSFSTFPIPRTKAVRWYLGAHGRLMSGAPSRGGVDHYISNAHAVPLNDFVGNMGTGGLWGNADQWNWRWHHNPSGTAVSYISAPLKHDTVVIGGGAIHLWIKSSTPDVDVQATVSEIDPGGREVFVQNGWLRASDRTLATGNHNIAAQRSTLLEPVLSLAAKDARPLPRNRFTKVVIPLYYEGHAYRKGTRIRITIAAPNGTQPVWSFGQTRPNSTAKVSIGYSHRMRSSLILPVVPGVSVPTGVPACGSLRDEPCRRYAPLVNQ